MDKQELSCILTFLGVIIVGALLFILGMKLCDVFIIDSYNRNKTDAASGAFNSENYGTIRLVSKEEE
jgi:hypothetical protein